MTSNWASFPATRKKSHQFVNYKLFLIYKSAYLMHFAEATFALSNAKVKIYLVDLSQHDVIYKHIKMKTNRINLLNN